MDAKQLCILFLLSIPVFAGAWKIAREEKDPSDAPEIREPRREIHYQTKRHLPEKAPKQRKPSSPTTQKISRDGRKKPSGHLAPLEEDDMDNDEVVSVAIGPPPIRPKYDKTHWKKPPKPSGTRNSANNMTAANIVKEVLIQIGRDLASRQVSEDFIFGQYVGNSMKNLTADIKLKMQHDILELIVKYQTLNRRDNSKLQEEPTTSSHNPLSVINTMKDMKPEKKVFTANDTEETWPDFSNLAKIVGK